ncbi:unnamed protein product [Oncorhynchus mykiss]|uniref:Ras-associating domain-containing protein n=1 Tax=Oncorhynchus mykiss TaxID=8022 RepID=A0A060W5U5_ONCMY|nr:unnamed protein product [Oncorhynchus mykiss]
MSPQQGTIGQNRSGSLTGDSKLCALPDSKKKMKTLAHRRQSAPSLVISKALTKSRSMSRENCLSPVSPETCPLVQAFLSPGRVFLAHAHTQLKTGLQTQERHLFLFTDTLLVAKAKSSTHFKLKAQVRLCEMWTAGCMEEVCEGSTSLDRSFVMGWPTFNCVAIFSSVEHKEKWLFLIKSRINEEKEKDDPKTIPLKIFAKDIGNCAYAKTLAVSNTDSTTDVIQMALQQFGISGCVKDHQLWVSSIKDDSPYPLIGHEFPFSIKMSHIRDGGGGGGKDAVPSPEGQGAMLLDQCLPPDTQCQFILKSSRVGPKQALLLGKCPFTHCDRLNRKKRLRFLQKNVSPPLCPCLLHTSFFCCCLKRLLFHTFRESERKSEHRECVFVQTLSFSISLHPSFIGMIVSQCNISNTSKAEHINSLTPPASLFSSLLPSVDVSSFQMNDSSYDSLENELNEDPESPFQESHPLRDKAKPDSCSRDSVITLSDCDPDPDPEADLHIPPLARPRKFTPALRQPRPRQCYVQSQGPRRLRRSSEPAIGHTPGALIIQSDKHHLASRKASYDAAMEGEEEEEEDEVFQGLRALQLKDKVIAGGERGGVGTLGQRKLKHTPPSPLRLDASCSSLSSPATSPTGSSLSSLDSAFSQYSTDYVTSAGFLLAESSPRSPLSPRSPKCSPPKRDTVDWSESQPPHSSRTPSTHHGLHPNTWLKRNLRLSLRQPDNGHLEEEVGKGKGVSLPKASEGKGVEVTTKRRSSSPPSYQQAILQLQKSRSPFYRGTEKPLTVRELQLLHDQACNATHRPPTERDVTQQPTGTGSEVIQPPQDVFYGQSGSTLTLQRQKSHSLTLAMEAGRKVLTLPRRASEPSMVTDAASILTLERPLRNGEGPNSEPRFCLSPSATRAVRDYFSSQERADSGACLQRSQEVALALVQGKREWQSRKCSDPCVDDFDQMFFAEESYV